MVLCWAGHGWSEWGFSFILMIAYTSAAHLIHYEYTSSITHSSLGYTSASLLMYLLYTGWYTLGPLAAHLQAWQYLIYIYSTWHWSQVMVMGAAGWTRGTPRISKDILISSSLCYNDCQCFLVRCNWFWCFNKHLWSQVLEVNTCW